MLRESSLFNQFDLNSKKWKPLFKHWNFSNLLTVLIIPRLLECLWSLGKSSITTAWWLAINWRDLCSILLVLQIMKIHFKCKLEEKSRFFTLHKTFCPLYPAIPKFKNPWLLKYFLHIRTNETPMINNLALLLFKRRLSFWNWSYHPCLPFLGIGDNDVMDELIP